MARYNGSISTNRDRTPPFPTRQMAILGTSMDVPRLSRPIANLRSAVSNLRANCIHVDLSIRILHGRRFWYTPREGQHVRGHGHVVVRIRRMHQRNILGPSQRSDRPEDGPSRRPLWHRAEHDPIWLRKKSTNGAGCSGSRRITEWVRSLYHLASALVNRICRNIGVLQTTVAELVTDERHQRKFEMTF